jgi:hypothetical protein
LDAIQLDLDIVDFSHYIIKGGTPWFYEEYKNADKRKLITIADFDIYANFDGLPSLKKLEANIGMNIEFSGVDFSQTTALTPEQWKILDYYNKYDCIALAIVAYIVNKNAGMITAHLLIADLYDIDFKEGMKLTPTALTAKVVGCVARKPETDFQFEIPLSLRNLKWKNSELHNIFSHLDVRYTPDDTELKYGYKNREDKEWETTPSGHNKTFKYTFPLKTIDLDVLFGGCHGCNKNKSYIATPQNEKVIVLADAASLYPTILKKYHLISRACADGGKGFFTIYDFRMLCKTLKDDMVVFNNKSLKRKEVVAGFKLPINGFSGAMAAYFSPAFDWVNNKSMCLIGQYLYAYFGEQLEQIDNLEIIQFNTDGIYYYMDKKDLPDYYAITRKLERESGFTIETDVIENGILAQRDVNNYLIVDFNENKKENHSKAKGDYGKLSGKEMTFKDPNDVEFKVHFPPIGKGADLNTNNEPIVYDLVEKAIRNKVKKENWETFAKSEIQKAVDLNEWWKFQIIVLAQKGHKLMIDKRYLDKVVRCFCVKGGSTIWNVRQLKAKDKQDESVKVVNGETLKFKKTSDVPNNVEIYNNVSDVCLSDILLDYNYYINRFVSAIDDLNYDEII